MNAAVAANSCGAGSRPQGSRSDAATAASMCRSQRSFACSSIGNGMWRIRSIGAPRSISLLPRATEVLREEQAEVELRLFSVIGIHRTQHRIGPDTVVEPLDELRKRTAFHPPGYRASRASGRSGVRAIRVPFQLSRFISRRFLRAISPTTTDSRHSLRPSPMAAGTRSADRFIVVAPRSLRHGWIPSWNAR